MLAGNHQSFEKLAHLGDLRRRSLVDSGRRTCASSESNARRRIICTIEYFAGHFYLGPDSHPLVAILTEEGIPSDGKADVTNRREVLDFVAAGPLPAEDADEDVIAEAERQLERITAPVSDQEAKLLATAFGSDNCYGLAWTLLHLIETAPGARTARYTRDPANVWVQLLNSRVGMVAGGHQVCDSRREDFVRGAVGM